LASILKVCKDKKGIVSDEVEMQKQFFEVFLVFFDQILFQFFIQSSWWDWDVRRTFGYYFVGV